ncbi:hypothetical protein ACU9SG_004331 [Serratia marcescens]
MGKLIQITAIHSVAADTIAEVYVIPGECVVVNLKNGTTLFPDVKEQETVCAAYHRILVEIQLSLSPEICLVNSGLQLEDSPLGEALRRNREERRFIAGNDLLK